MISPNSPRIKTSIYKRYSNFQISNKTQLFKSLLQDVGVQKALDKFYPTKEWQDNAIQDFTQFRNFLTNTIRKEPTKFFDENFLTNVDENPPTFSELTSICQASKVQMLHKIGKHIITNFDQSRGLSENLGAWIYGILALLEKPLTPDCCFKLREFAKKCAQIRATFSSEIDESLATPLNLYICIVARYFNQLDLIN